VNKKCMYKYIMELLDIIPVGILVYSLVLIFDNTVKINVLGNLIKKYKENKKEAIIGLLLLILLTGIYIYYRIIEVENIDKNLKKKIRLYHNAYISGILALVIAYFAYIDKILPAFFFVFVIHYYLQLNE
tara:strand:- start:879 stop:1268 length:390 start_codon:yes stop_codon:yes gene_type:complete